MKNLTAFLASAILLGLGLGCSDTGKATELGNTDNPPVTKSASESEVFIASVKLFRDDGEGGEGEEVKAFTPADNPQHFKARMSEFEGGTKLKMVWTAVDAGGQKNFKILEKEIETTSLENEMTAKVKLPNPFPAGDYKVDVFVNGKLSKTQNYQVQ